jgi:MFS family permease
MSYAAFVLVGINVGISGVLLPSQMASYGVDRATIGIIFFTGSAGFVLASVSTGALIHRAGIRIALTAGGGAFVLAGLYLATRPPFIAFVLAQLVLGYGTGVLESALNVYIAGLPGATTLLNRLHAFFGVGALVGPPLATWILGFASWTVVWLVVAGACVPLVAGFLLAYPGPERLRRRAPRAACCTPRSGTGVSSSARRCCSSTSVSSSAWATGGSATWCRRGACTSQSPATRSAGSGWG